MPELSPMLLERYIPRARTYLINAARERRLVPYMEITRALGTSRAYIGQVLDELNRREHRHQRPLLSAIVVQAASGTPGEGFYLLVKSLRNAPGSGHAAWLAERDKVWAYDWTA